MFGDEGQCLLCSVVVIEIRMQTREEEPPFIRMVTRASGRCRRRRDWEDCGLPCVVCYLQCLAASDVLEYELAVGQVPVAFLQMMQR